MSLDWGNFDDWDRTFGFLNRSLSRPKDSRRRGVFVHISAVRDQAPTLAKELSWGRFTSTAMWYVATDKGKGDEVERMWVNLSDVPEELRIDAEKRAKDYWANLDSEPPALLYSVSTLLFGQQEADRLRDGRQGAIETRKRALEEAARLEAERIKQAYEESTLQLKQALERELPPRAVEIKAFCERRGITQLVHFTPQMNLRSILDHGLLGRTECRRRNLPYKVPDAQRLDGHQNAVCTSLSFPNYRMFYKYRSKYPSVHWAVLVLEPAVLWCLDCAFCFTNAASNDVRGLQLGELRTVRALERMFHSEDDRAARGLPPSFPTDPQAEVLVFDSIPSYFIREVHFQHWRTTPSQEPAERRRYLARFLTDKHFFTPRVDYEYWQAQVYDEQECYDQY